MRRPPRPETLLCLLALAAPARAAESADSAPSMTPLLAVEKVTLDNGLEMLFHEDRRLPVVCVDVWYHVGALHEDAGKSGFAHLFEHLMFQGSSHVPGDNHIKLLEAAGASMLNGTTSFGQTKYYQCVPRNEVELALWLESDRMGWLTTVMTQAKLDEQRNVVKNERRATVENRPWGLADEKAWQRLFPETHPYRGMVIGSMADLDRASLEDVLRFHDTYYAPSNATLAVTGDIGRAEALELVAKYFQTLPRWPKPPQRVLPAPAVTEEVRVEVEDALASVAKVTVRYLTPAAYASGSAEIAVLARLLGHGNGSRLHQALVVDGNLAHEVEASHHQARGTSVLTLSAVVREEQSPEAVLSAIQAQLDLLQDLAPGEDELVRAVNTFEGEQMRRLQMPIGRAEMLQHYNHYVGDPAWFDQDLARMRAVTPESIQAAAAAHLGKNRRVVLLARPRGSAPGARDAGTESKGGA